MAYNINHTSSDYPQITVDDETVNENAASITFIGKNYAGYGQIQNENFLHILENFADTTSPSLPTIGQLWYDTSSKTLKVYCGKNGSNFIWKPATAVNVESNLVANFVSNGELWYDTTVNKLKIKIDTNWTVLGPGNVPVYSSESVRNQREGSSPIPGSICLISGGKFQGYNGTAWVDLS